MNLQDKSNSIFCDTCGENVTGGKKGLESHYKRCHKPIICENCGFGVQGWQQYHCHKRHCDKRTCEKCLKEISKKNFARHVKECGTSASDAGGYSCDQCDYKTFRKDHLLR